MNSFGAYLRNRQVQLALPIRKIAAKQGYVIPPLHSENVQAALNEYEKVIEG